MIDGRRALLPAGAMLAFLAAFQLAAAVNMLPATLASPLQIAKGVADSADLLWFHL